MLTQSLYLPPTGWVRKNVVLAHVPFGGTKLDSEIKDGRFPKPRDFGPRMVAWDAAEVHAWISDPEAWIEAKRTGGKAPSPGAGAMALATAKAAAPGLAAVA